MPEVTLQPVIVPQGENEVYVRWSDHQENIRQLESTVAKLRKALEWIMDMTNDAHVAVRARTALEETK